MEFSAYLLKKVPEKYGRPKLAHAALSVIWGSSLSEGTGASGPYLNYSICSYCFGKISSLAYEKWLAVSSAFML